MLQRVIGAKHDDLQVEAVASFDQRNHGQDVVAESCALPPQQVGLVAPPCCTLPYGGLGIRSTQAVTKNDPAIL
jgi:hypothetical protein